jgi:predicted AlkP superfamily phosphohydrolase/phosphomutase
VLHRVQNLLVDDLETFGLCLGYVNIEAHQMSSPTKLLVIGIDAADKDLILQWTAEGLLPTMGRLLQEAAWGFTENPPGLYVGAVWPSFYTGVSPAEHTRYCYEQLKPGTYDNFRFRPDDVKAEPFWDVLSRAHKKVAIIDVPKSCPSKSINGIQIVDWGAHDADHAGLCTSPPELADEVVQRFGTDPIGDCNAYRTRPEEFTGFRDDLVSRAARKAELSTHYLQQGGWDCFVTTFSESHCAGHQCWHLHDPGVPRHDPVLAHAVGDPLKDVYIAIDAAIGRLLDDAGADTTTIVLTSHGFGPHYDATFLLDGMLDRLAAANRRGVPPVSPARGLKRIWRRLPLGLRYRLVPLRDKVKRMGLNPRVQCDAFAVPNNDVFGAIRINLVGREPQGRITPGPEYEACCQRLTKDLLQFTNVETGEPLVRNVFRVSDLYHGTQMDYLPDLLVEWNRDAPVRIIHSPKTGNITGKYEMCRTGDHKATGMFFVRGPGVTQGQIKRTVSVMDFAPSITSFLGVDASQFEGRAFLDEIGLTNRGAIHVNG